MYTFREFCAYAKISMRTFVTMRLQGRAPDIIYISPRCPRITYEAAQEWLKAQERAA